ncbi:hypothetical protein PIIN_08253 [Serendipita indica DSM 11827]|uniref:Methyltransferase type 11 domain-containing protein n=1 Tax=Serendipita indica (strain DSM 11827) TaxID=1109443 RepID=G4TSK7_SERID|nr:hypothetical protein PIIN_08253 [Serendipita indica DSM 11827]
MAAFAKGAYDAAAYNAFRPVYPPKLFDKLWSFHRSGRNARWTRAVDLGCGTGQATLKLTTQFEHAIGVDPSPKMIQQANELISSSPFHNPPNGNRRIVFENAPAEKLAFLQDESVDFVSAAQAVHWFDYARLWREINRVLRPGGSVAFWGYSELRIRHFPYLTPIITYYSQGSSPRQPQPPSNLDLQPDILANEPLTHAASSRTGTMARVEPEPDSLGAYWEQPGRSILDGGLLSIPNPPSSAHFDLSASQVVLYSGSLRPDVFQAFTDYENRQIEGKKREIVQEDVVLEKEMTWELLERYCRTWSSLATYLEQHPDEKERRDGDILQRFLKRMKDEIVSRGEAVPESLTVEWPMTLLLYRKGD